MHLLAAGLMILTAVLIVCWIYWRKRMARIDSLVRDLTARVELLSSAIVDLKRGADVTPLGPAQSPSTGAEPAPEPYGRPPVPAEPVLHAAEAQPEAPGQLVDGRVAPWRSRAPALVTLHSSEEWETLLGGNWLNKIGVFVLVIGIALALGYSFTQTGPWGRVSISVAASLAMLISGATLESRERYRIFARGLLGGGWAALYVTVYATHAIEAARIVESPVLATVLLFAVAAGMILHALRYRSRTVTGVAYFAAFGTLAITEVRAFAFIALVPLAASLLYVAHRFMWSRMSTWGLLGTYAVVVWRGATETPLWQAQTIFVIYWLLFEVFDIRHPEPWLLPLNAVGFLGLSVLRWQWAAPSQLWMLLGAAAAAYLVSAVARRRSTTWRGAATLTAALAAAAIFQKLSHQWVASALLVEAELFYLAGWGLRAPYLRWLGTGLFGVQLLRLVFSDLFWLPSAAWLPVASLNAAVFYANRALASADLFFGYAGAAMLALVLGYQAHEPYRNPAWVALAAAAFAFGWWRRLFDFRLQGYLLLVLALAGTLLKLRQPSLWVVTLVCYAAVLCALWSEQARLRESERDWLRRAGAAATTLALTALTWRLAPGLYLGVGWMALAVLLLELGLHRLPDEFAGLAFAVASVGAVRVWAFNIVGLPPSRPWDARLVPLGAALLAYTLALRARHSARGRAFAVGSSAGLALLLAALWAMLASELVAVAWAATALALLVGERRWRLPLLGWQSVAVAALAYLPIARDLPDPNVPLWAHCAAIGCLFAAQLVTAPGGRRRLFYSLTATAFTTLMLYFRISGKMLTVACGIQGAAWLTLGFPMRDRVLRLSGLALLFACILKLFLWDLRRLETLSRIFSFIVLGLILLAVSWAYTRFRERVAKFL